jgi:hydroxyacylglutathione hydrolase
VQDIEPADVWSHRKQLAIIDVRRPDEFTGELGHIENAELMVLDTLPQRFEEIPRDKTVVFVCRSGARSGHAAQFALEQGLTHVFNMRGGMLLWNELGLEVLEKNV